MNVAGAIFEAGNKPLRNFTWGESAVTAIVNALPTNENITLDSTGAEISHILKKLKNDVAQNIMNTEISKTSSVFTMDKNKLESEKAEALVEGRRRSDAYRINNELKHKDNLRLGFALLMLLSMALATLAFVNNSELVGTAEYDAKNTGVKEFIFELIRTVVENKTK